MKTYKTVDDYLKEAKPNDKVIFGGYGIIDGLKYINKANTYTVQGIRNGGVLVLKAYKGRTNLVLGANAYDQAMVVMDNKEFRELPVY